MNLPHSSDPEATEDDSGSDALREEKVEQTSHWDMDMLSRDQLDKLAKASRRKHLNNALKRAAIGGGIGVVIAVVIAIALAAFRG